MGTESVLQDGALSSVAEAQKDQKGVVKRWLAEIDLADKVEKNWRKDATNAREIYRGKKKTQNSFNILWANTEVIRPNLYNSTPRPDVRRRYRDADPVGKECSELLERALSFEADACDFDGVMGSTVFDSVLPGRGVARVHLEPYYDEVTDEQGKVTRTLAGAKAYPERVEWDMFRRGPASCWEDVPWVAYEHHLTKDDVKEQLPKYANKVQYDVTVSGVSEDHANKEPNVFKRCRVWEIWDKQSRKVIWIAPSFDEAPLATEDDKLNLKGFFDCPSPLYAIDDTSSLEPICEYTLYESQAKELNRITQRINKLVDALKVRGIYDNTLGEVKSLLDSSDNDMIPTKDSAGVLQAGGFDKAIWLMPIDKLAQVLVQLYTQREQVKAVIYEIIGISDILRGSTDPNETLGAQELKAQTGSVRLQRRQRDVQRFARDLFRIMAEIISEHFPPQLLQIMTGIQVTDEMIQVLRRDLLRGIRVDIETDSTIAADQEKTRKEVTELMEGVGGFLQSFGPAIQEGAISQAAGKKIFLSIIRKAKLGRDVEDALEQEEQQPQQQKPDPEMMKMQAEQQQQQAQMQMDQAKAQQEMQLKQQELQANMEIEQAKLSLEERKAILELQQEKELKLLEMQMNQQLEAQKAQNQLQVEGMKADNQMKLKKSELKVNERIALMKPSKDVALAVDDQDLNDEDEGPTKLDQIMQGQADQTQSVQSAMQEQTAILQQITQSLMKSVQGIEAVMKTVSAPKKITRDKSGRVSGVEVIQQ